MMGDCVNEDECSTGNNDCPLPPIGLCIDTHPTQSGYFCDCIEGYTYQTGKNQLFEIIAQAHSFGPKPLVDSYHVNGGMEIELE